jgi:hypothetical protein
MLDFGVNVQQQLIVAALDDFCANAALPHLYGGQFGDTPNLWRAAVVQFLSESLTAGLVEVLPGEVRYRQKGAIEICRLLTEGDIENGLSSDEVWQVIYFQGTEKLRGILKEFQLDNWDAMKTEVSMHLEQVLWGRT